MKKLILIVAALCCFLLSDFSLLEAATSNRSQYEDTIGESIWDWSTTLGKTPQEKKKIKAKRRVQRARKRAEKKASVERVQLEKENRRREAEAQKIRNARIKARQRAIEKKTRSQED